MLLRLCFQIRLRVSLWLLAPLPSHRWTAWEEKARREEKMQTEMLEHLGESVRVRILRQLKTLRDVYADLTEFAPIWEAIDRVGTLDPNLDPISHN